MSLIKKISLKLMWGAIAGGSLSIFIYTLNKFSFFGFAVFAGVIVSLSSIPFTKRKIIYCLISAIAGWSFLLAISKIPFLERGDTWWFLVLPTFGLFLSIGIGLSDRSIFKAITGIVGGFIASVISTAMFFIVVIKYIGIWGSSNPAEPIYAYFLFSVSSILMLFSIEIGDFFKRGHLIRDEKNFR